jgi:hypothetical protein
VKILRDRRYTHSGNCRTKRLFFIHDSPPVKFYDGKRATTGTARAAAESTCNNIVSVGFYDRFTSDYNIDTSVRCVCNVRTMRAYAFSIGTRVTRRTDDIVAGTDAARPCHRNSTSSLHCRRRAEIKRNILYRKRYRLCINLMKRRRWREVIYWKKCRSASSR